LLRPALASSSYDYNLTAQLVTDGVVDRHLPSWITTVVEGEILPKNEREIVVGHFKFAVLELPGSSPSVELHLGGGATLPEVDQVHLFVVVPDHISPGALRLTVSEDGHHWREVGSADGGVPLPPESYPPDLVRGTHLLNPSIAFNGPFRGRYYRATFGTCDRGRGPLSGNTANAGTIKAAMASTTRSISWRLSQLAFFRGANRGQIRRPYSFTSAWKSASIDEEWVSVDLGAPFAFDRVKLHWIACAAEGRLQVSDDSHQWRDVHPLGTAGGPVTVEDVQLAAPVTARYVRALMTRPGSPDG
ncbi:MAG: discoidin domain-containing protein, partial [Janthinobacterium lividum]